MTPDEARMIVAAENHRLALLHTAERIMQEERVKAERHRQHLVDFFRHSPRIWR